MAATNWQPDDAVSSCPFCAKSFSLFFRKHHCRNCGRVVCVDCSTASAPRMCVECNRTHRPAPEAKPQSTSSNNTPTPTATAAKAAVSSPQGQRQGAPAAAGRGGGGQPPAVAAPAAASPPKPQPTPVAAATNNKAAAAPTAANGAKAAPGSPAAVGTKKAANTPAQPSGANDPRPAAPAAPGTGAPTSANATTTSRPTTLTAKPMHVDPGVKSPTSPSGTGPRGQVARGDSHEVSVLSRLVRCGEMKEKQMGVSKAQIAEGLLTFCEKLDDLAKNIPVVSQITGILTAIARCVKNVYANEELVEDLLSRIEAFRGPLSEYFRRLGGSAAVEQAATAGAVKKFVDALQLAQALVEKFSAEPKTVLEKIRHFAAKVTEHGKAFADVHAALQQAASDLQLAVVLAPPPSRNDVDRMLVAESQRCYAVMESVAAGVQELSRGQAAILSQMDVLSSKLNSVAFTISSGLQRSWKCIPRGELKLDYSQVVGAGSQAIVVSGTYKGKAICAKIAKPAVVMDEGKLEELYREAAILSSYSHANIVAFFGVCAEEGSMILVEEAAECSLQDVIFGVRPVPLLRALVIAQSILKAMVYLHSRDVIHRDIKPENVLLTHDGTAKLADFGKAKVQSTIGRQATEYQGGSVAYTAPEVLRGSCMTKAADMYSFGVTLREVVSGRHAWEGQQNNPALIAKILEGASVDDEDNDSSNTTSAAAVGDAARPWQQNLYVKAIVQSCLSRVPTNRPTAEALLTEVEHAIRRISGDSSEGGGVGAEDGPSSPLLVNDRNPETSVMLFSSLTAFQLQRQLLVKCGDHEPVAEAIVRYILDCDYTGAEVLEPEFVQEITPITKVLERRRFAERIDAIRKSKPATDDNDENVAGQVRRAASPAAAVSRVAATQWLDPVKHRQTLLWPAQMLELDVDGAIAMLRSHRVSEDLLKTLQRHRCKPRELLDLEVVEDLISNTSTLLHRKRLLAVLSGIRDKSASVSLASSGGMIEPKEEVVHTSDVESALALFGRAADFARDVDSLYAITEMSALILSACSAAPDRDRALSSYFRAVTAYFTTVDPQLSGGLPGPSVVRTFAHAVEFCASESTFVAACEALMAQCGKVFASSSSPGTVPPPPSVGIMWYSSLLTSDVRLRDAIRTQASRLVASQANAKLAVACLILMRCARVERMEMLGGTVVWETNLAMCEWYIARWGSDFSTVWSTAYAELGHDQSICINGQSLCMEEFGRLMLATLPGDGVCTAQLVLGVYYLPRSKWKVQTDTGAALTYLELIQNAYHILGYGHYLPYFYLSVLLSRLPSAQMHDSATSEGATAVLGGVTYDSDSALAAALERNPYSPLLWSALKGTALPVVDERRNLRMTKRQALMRALELDSQYSSAWLSLYVDLKGTETVIIAGESYNRVDCAKMAVCTKPTLHTYWNSLGNAMGAQDTVTLTLHGKSETMTRRDVLCRGLELSPPAERRISQTWAWINMGKLISSSSAAVDDAAASSSSTATSVVIIRGEPYNRLKCLARAAAGTTTPAAWVAIGNALGNTERLTLDEGLSATTLTKVDCLARMGTSWTNAWDWANLASAMRALDMDSVLMSNTATGAAGAAPSPVSRERKPTGDEPNSPVATEGTYGGHDDSTPTSLAAAAPSVATSSSSSGGGDASTRMTRMDVIEKALQLLPTSAAIWAKVTACIPPSNTRPLVVDGQTLQVHELLVRAMEKNPTMVTAAHLLVFYMFQHNIPAVTVRGVSKRIPDLLCPVLDPSTVGGNTALWYILAKTMTTSPIAVGKAGEQKVTWREALRRALIGPTPMADANLLLGADLKLDEAMDLGDGRAPVTGLQLLERYLSAVGNVPKVAWEKIREKLGSREIQYRGQALKAADIQRKIEEASAASSTSV